MDTFLQHDAGEKVGEDDKDSIGRHADKDSTSMYGRHNKDNKFREMVKNEICWCSKSVFMHDALDWISLAFCVIISLVTACRFWIDIFRTRVVSDYAWIEIK